jgi:hypothetical protein
VAVKSILKGDPIVNLVSKMDEYPAMLRRLKQVEGSELVGRFNRGVKFGTFKKVSVEAAATASQLKGLRKTVEAIDRRGGLGS